LKPTRLRCCVTLLESFLEEFQSLNPISQTALVITRSKRAELASELAGNPKRHSEVMRSLSEPSNAARGEPSLQNALEVALRGLRNMPAHASREILILMGSLTTCDPGDIEAVIEECVKLNVRCSVISLAAEVRIYKHLSKRTGGEFGVILDDVHLRELLHAHLEPPPSAVAAEASLVKMGFPSHTGHNSAEAGLASGLGMSMCSLDGQNGKLTVSGFLCPQCGGKYLELPVECRICGLTLVSAPHLARSYHHLFPLLPFEEVPLENLGQTAGGSCCTACNKRFKEEKMVFKCPTCRQFYCSECDVFAHEILHACPACAAKGVGQQQVTNGKQH